MKHCRECGDLLDDDTPYVSCNECIARNSVHLDDLDHDIEEFDSVEEMTQQALNEALGLD